VTIRRSARLWYRLDVGKRLLASFQEREHSKQRGQRDSHAIILRVGAEFISPFPPAIRSSNGNSRFPQRMPTRAD
jgi:hypothetical protein